MASLALLVLLYGTIPYFSTYNSSIPISVMRLLWELWNAPNSDWQHGLFVPMISGVLIYLKWNKLKRLPMTGANSGLVFFGFGLLLYYLGYLADLKPVGFLSIQVVIGGLIIWFLGWPFFRAILFPWGFLVFAWPFSFLESTIALPLRLAMANIAYVLLNLIGLDCMKIGSAIVSSPDYTFGLKAGAKFAIDIADPCSGIRSLFALLMISALFGQFSVSKPWKRWVLFLSAFPLSVLGNVVRIVILTFATLLFGSGFAVGTIDHPTWFHETAGFFVYIAALGGMMGIAWALEADWKKLQTQWKNWCHHILTAPAQPIPGKEAK